MLYVMFAVLCGAFAWGFRQGTYWMDWAPVELPDRLVLHDPLLARTLRRRLDPAARDHQHRHAGHRRQPVLDGSLLCRSTLLTFVLAFERDRWYPRLPFAIAAGCASSRWLRRGQRRHRVAIWIQLGVYMAALFAVCMVCHGELRYSRPEPRHLTLFYLTIAAGGVLGGVFGRAHRPAPVFTEFNEYPIGLAAGCLLGLAVGCDPGRGLTVTRSNFAIRIPIMALLLGGLSSTLTVTMSGAHKAAGTWRNFYGILRVTDVPDPHGEMRELTHGRIKHGSQYLEQTLRDRPISYYGPHSGVAMALNALPEGPRKIAVIGLGTGTMAAWAARRSHPLLRNQSAG